MYFDDVIQELRQPNVREMETRLLDLVRNVFRSQRDPWGVPWPTLAPATLRSRRLRGLDGTQALFATGALFASIDSDRTDDSVTLEIGGTGQGGADSVEFHQFGDGVPQRAMLPFGRDIPGRWWKAIEEPIANRLGDPA